MTAAAHAAAVLGTVGCLATSAAFARRIPAPQDELWFLQVVTRVLRGRRLYDQVFYGSGPLAVWLAAAVQRGREPSLPRLRVLSAVVQAATALALLETLVVLGHGPVTVLAAALAIAGFEPAWPIDNLYGALARCGLALTSLALAAASAAPPLASVLAAASGVALAAGLLAKHTVAAAGALVVVPAWLLVAGWEEALACLVATALPCLAAVLVLHRQRVLGACVRRTVLNKRTYLETGRVSPVQAFVETVRTPTPRRWVHVWAFVVLVAAPVAAVSALLSGRSGAVAALTLAATLLAGAVPRADTAHVRPAAPLGATAVAACIPEGLPSQVCAAVLAVVGVVALVRSVQVHPPHVPTADSPVLAGVPTAIPVTPESLAAGEVVRRTAGRKVFVLRGDAAQWYLLLGLVNPTAYDYPYASTFGPHGQRDVADRLVPGDIEWCLHVPAGVGALSPHLLEQVVRERMRLVEHTAVGDLYRAV